MNIYGRTVAEAKAPIFWLPEAKCQLIGKTMMLGKTEGKRRRGQQEEMIRYSITDSMDMNLSELHETVEDRGAWHARVHGVAKNWT